MPALSRRGFSIIEVVIAAAIVVTVVTGVAGAWQFYVRLSGESTRLAAAALLIEEGSEVVELWRNHSWSQNIATLQQDIIYYLIWNGSSYEATTTPTIIDNAYYRTVEAFETYRDASANLTFFGTLDPLTKRIDLKVTPKDDLGSPILTAEMYIHNVFSN